MQFPEGHPMRRFPFGPLAVVLFAALPAPATGQDSILHAPHTRLATADVAVVGEVTSIDKETVEAELNPGDGKTVEHTVAVVKVEANLSGAKTVTHVKVGFVRPGPPDLAEGERYCFFLQKHPDAGFYVVPNFAPPIRATPDTDGLFDDLTRAAVALRNPLKALAAKDDGERLFAARVLVLRYRTTRYVGRGNRQMTAATTEEAVPLEESQLILRAFAEVEWPDEKDWDRTLTAFYSIGLTAADKFAPAAARPGQNAADLNRAELKRWLAADGANYRIKKLVPKTK